MKSQLQQVLYARKRSVFIGVKSIFESVLLEKTVGDYVFISCNLLGSAQRLAGEIVASKVSAHGKLLLVKNAHYNNHLAPSACVGWEYIPLWVSACGQSGILAIWKDAEADQMIQDYRNQVEREVACAMAL
jgi:hypothetical protein